MDLNYRHDGNSDLPEQCDLPSNYYNRGQFGRTTNPIAKRMLSNVTMSPYRPMGSLAIVDLAKDGIPVAIIILWWRS